jgi:hypothetical protein
VKVLIACEESQAVCKAFRKLGIEAYSCDIYKCSGGHPEWHIQCDVSNILSAGCFFVTQDGKLHYVSEWVLIIAFPPCTHLAASGSKHFKKKRESGVQQEAIRFFKLFTKAKCARIGIENPIGIMSSEYRKPTQIINPWEFGESVNKKTCLWLKGLPKLKPTNIVQKDDFVVMPSGKKMSRWYYETSCLPPSERSKARSKTFTGIAEAMAKQWSRIL